MNTNDIWLIAGLGNPEPKYDGTRHNAGFSALDDLAGRWGISVSKTKFQGLWGQGEVSIIARLGGENFPRIRIGVGAKPRPDYDLADWVLGKFPPDDAKALADRLPDLEAAAKLIMDGKLGLAQSKYNG